MRPDAAAPRAALDPLPRIIRKLPKHCLERSPFRSAQYLVRDLAMAGGLGWAILALHHGTFAPPVVNILLATVLSGLLGCVLTGLFVVGHDAGHRSFGGSARLNDAVGHIAMAPLLWPFHVWRLSHDHHHRWTHHASNEIAWRPLTVAEYTGLTPLKRRIYKLSRSSLFFLASMLFQFFYVKDAVTGAFFDRADARALRFSLRVTAWAGILYIGTVAWAGGWYGLVFVFLLPQLVFHFWLSTFTLFHHTSPENQLMPEGHWSPEAAQLTMSVHVFYPQLVDWLTHDIGWHVPHHVCVGVPHYHLRDAHKALKAAYPEWVQEKRLTWGFVRSVLGDCHLIAHQSAPGGQAWQTAPAEPQAVRSASRI
jgi:omega-6 fatty acid desaturase (delta-12 desaturase)